MTAMGIIFGRGTCLSFPLTSQLTLYKVRSSQNFFEEKILEPTGDRSGSILNVNAVKYMRCIKAETIAVIVMHLRASVSVPMYTVNIGSIKIWVKGRDIGSRSYKLWNAYSLIFYIPFFKFQIFFLLNF